MTHIMKIDEMSQTMFYVWNISKATEEWEVLEFVESSEDIAYGQKTYRTPDAAYRAGLRELKTYKEGIFMLEVHSENIDKYPRNDSINYESGYMALSVNGKIQEA